MPEQLEQHSVPQPERGSLSKYFVIIKEGDPTLRHGKVVYEKQDTGSHFSADHKIYGYVDRYNPRGKGTGIGIKV